jgi:2-iminobutanoate/2-iminopropanoate deaminase
MKIQINHPDRDSSFVTGAYSDGILIDGYLFVSGQASVDFKSSKFILGSIEDETHRTLQNIQAIIKAGGASISDVVKCTVHLANINDFDRYNEVYSQYFKGIKPARTTVQSVLVENIKIEIDCIVKLS